MGFARRRRLVDSRIRRVARTALSKRQVKAVVEIAKKVDYKNDETKSIQSPAGGLNSPVNPTAGALASWNLTYRMVAGIGSNAVIGKAFHLDKLQLKYGLYRDPGSTDTEMNPAIARVMLLWADVETNSTLTKTDIFLPDTYNVAGSQGQSRGIVDTGKCRVIYDRTHVLVPNSPNQQNVILQTVNKKLNRTLSFKQDPGTITAGTYPNQKKGNLYYVVIPDTFSGWTVAQTPNIAGEMRFLMTYKDA